MCVLRVGGRRFDPDTFLASSTLKPYEIFHAGERFSPTSGKRCRESGFKVDVSRRSWDSLDGQVDDAIKFLTRHARTLKTLRTIREVRDIRLDFPLDLRIDRKKVFAQFDYSPPKR